jgi:hypothetical protein
LSRLDGDVFADCPLLKSIAIPPLSKELIINLGSTLECGESD